MSDAESNDIERLRRELDTLRAENARLVRLLDLRGDVVPPPEQPAAALAPPGLVTIGSSSADKLALYRSLFRARADVYAVRWENPRAGKAGWMPAVAGGWRKGTDRSTIEVQRSTTVTGIEKTATGYRVGVEQSGNAATIECDLVVHGAGSRQSRSAGL
jgi:hypothetical protein